MHGRWPPHARPRAVGSSMPMPCRCVIMRGLHWGWWHGRAHASTKMHHRHAHSAPTAKSEAHIVLYIEAMYLCHGARELVSAYARGCPYGCQQQQQLKKAHSISKCTTQFESHHSRWYDIIPTLTRSATHAHIGLFMCPSEIDIPVRPLHRTPLPSTRRRPPF